MKAIYAFDENLITKKGEIVLSRGQGREYTEYSLYAAMNINKHGQQQFGLSYAYALIL